MAKNGLWVRPNRVDLETGSPENGGVLTCGYDASPLAFSIWLRLGMENFKLVLPEHLNHYGFLFGGYLLKFVDEIAWIAASLEYPGYNFVTIGMDKVEFRKSVRQGTILRFHSMKTRVGNTSVTFLVEVFSDAENGEKQSVFSTSVTLVRVDEDGNKKSIDG